VHRAGWHEKQEGEEDDPDKASEAPPVGLAFDDFRTNVHDSFLIVLEIRWKVRRSFTMA
jgi:hypothetical protein